jgi:ribosomal-protein-alanine N-acetyltransferase
MHTLETERLLLRMFRPDDLDDYQRVIYGDAAVMVYMPGGVPRSRERTKAVLDFSIEHGQRHGFTLWAVLNKRDQTFLGHCGLVYLHDSRDEVELAYALGKACWGQGYASEAARAALRYGFEMAAVPYILALAVPENFASQRVMHKAGMKHQGITNRYHHTDLVLYRLERADWLPDDTFYRLADDNDT